jgi:hypothetical protein
VTFQAGQGSALLIENNVEDPDRNQLPEIVQRGLGITGGDTNGLPQWGVTNGQMRLTFQQATNDPLTEVVLQERGSLTENWRDAVPGGSTALGGTNNLERRQLTIPIGSEPMKIYQLGVRTRLWQK